MEDLEPFLHAMRASRKEFASTFVSSPAEMGHRSGEAIRAAHRSKIPNQGVQPVVTHLQSIDVYDNVPKSRAA